MGFDPNWPRWIKASIQNWIEIHKNTYNVFYEGSERKTNKVPAWIECRTNGLEVWETTKDFYRLTFEINLLCSCPVTSDIYNIDRMVGDVISWLTPSIGAYKFGTGVDDDPSIFIGCMIQMLSNKQNILMREYGQIDPTVKLIEATVSSKYFIEIP